MGRIVIFILQFFICVSVYALTPPDIFKKDIHLIELMGNKVETPKNISDIPFGLPKIDRFLQDPDNLVNKQFKTTPYFYSDEKFWFYIYTVFSSHHVVIHDKENLGLIYDVLEFDELKNSNLSSYTKFALKGRLTDAQIKNFKGDFKFLEKNNAKTVSQKKIIAALKKVKFAIPPLGKKRGLFFRSLSSNLRTQTGQKDFIQSALDNYSPYARTFEVWLDYFDMPRELIWISFIESSFNTKAKSKVGATGVWQFMRRIGKHFMPYGKSKDGRLNPAMSTLAAFHLLAQNKKILKRWDLAIPAYNSGTKHIIKARRKLGMEKPPLSKVLSSYDHPHLGFASRAFYSEFIALSHAMAYKKNFYDTSKFFKKYKKLNVYVSKCQISKSWFTNALKMKEPRINEYNSHLKYKKYLYPKGTVLFSTTELTERRYLKVGLNELRRNYPKNLKKLIKGHNCSTK